MKKCRCRPVNCSKQTRHGAIRNALPYRLKSLTVGVFQWSVESHVQLACRQREQTDESRFCGTVQRMAFCIFYFTAVLNVIFSGTRNQQGQRVRPLLGPSGDCFAFRDASIQFRFGRLQRVLFESMTRRTIVTGLVHCFENDHKLCLFHAQVVSTVLHLQSSSLSILCHNNVRATRLAHSVVEL